MMNESLSTPAATQRWQAWLLPALVVAGAILAANAQVILGLFQTWYLSYSETGHGFIAPPLALYVIWMKKDKLLQLPKAGSNWGLAVFVSAAVMVVLAEFSQLVFFSQFGVWLMMGGALLFLLGWAWVRELQFPLFLLFLTIPPPTFLYTRLTFEMQLMASVMAEAGLSALGYSILREGNVLQMVGETLSVAEACSGIRSLVTLLFFVVVYGYFVVERPRARWILALAAIPIAVLANGLRIIATGIMSQYNREWARGFTHEATGYLTLLVGGLCCILLEQFLRSSDGIPEGLEERISS